MQLKSETAKDHRREVGRLLKIVGKDPREITSQDIRSFLKQFENRAPNTKANMLKAFRRFFRDFMKMVDVIESFRLPKKAFEPKLVPSKDQLKAFYYALETPKERALFLFYATTGLRKNEVLKLKTSDIDFAGRIVVPKKQSQTKHTWISFFNEEAEKALKECLTTRKDSNPKLFPIGTHEFQRFWKKTYKKTGIKITPQILREWFCSEMGKLGVQDRYVDAFCGRVPKSVLAKHYSDYSPETLKQIYDNAGLKVLS